MRYIDYKIAFDQNATQEFKDTVLGYIIAFHNRNELADSEIIAELTESVFRVDSDTKTLTFCHVGF